MTPDVLGAESLSRNKSSPGFPKPTNSRQIQQFAEGGPAGLARRLAKHGTADGAKLLAAAKAAGLTWHLGRTWPGTRARERQLKRQGGAARRCPLCGITPRPGALPSPTRWPKPISSPWIRR